MALKNPNTTTTLELTTPAQRREWWLGLEDQWKMAFNRAVLQKAEVTDMPGDEEMISILTTPTLRIVGPRGDYPSVSFEVTNLSGCKHLTKLELLVVTFCRLTSLEEIEHLTQLKSVFVNNNQITSLKGIEKLHNLETILANVNALTSIKEVKKLANLKVFYCNYNQISSLDGISKIHQEKMQQFVCLPNENLPRSEVMRVEKKYMIKCFKG